MTDLIIDSNQDLEIVNGDFVTGDSTIQHQDLLLMTVKGEWKENPAIGVGLVGFLKDEDVWGMMAEIKTEFERDGMTVRDIDLVDEKLLIDAQYK